jgi:uncharacterized metal-binding protein
MPSGQTHDRLTFWLLPWIIGFTLLITRNGQITLIFASCFLFSGLMFGPDLDIYSVQFKRWGKFRFIWRPYQKLLSHRSNLSHGFLIGTIIRLIYFSIWLFFASIFLVGIGQLIWGFEWNWQLFLTQTGPKILENYKKEAIAFFWGLEIGAMSHYLADWTNTAYKKYQKQGIKGIIKKKPQPKRRRKANHQKPGTSKR